MLTVGRVISTNVSQINQCLKPFGAITMLLRDRVSHVWICTLSANCVETGFGFPIVCKSRKSPFVDKAFETIIGRPEERKVVGKKHRKNFLALFAAISQCRLCAWGPCSGVRRAMALIGKALQGKKWSGWNRTNRPWTNNSKVSPIASLCAMHCLFILNTKSWFCPWSSLCCSSNTVRQRWGV